MSDKILPDAFADLAPLAAEWALSTEERRARKRHTTDLASIRAFYNRAFPRIEDIIAYLNQFPNDPGALAPPERRLFDLAMTLMEIAAPIDLEWPTGDITDAFPINRFTFLPPSAG